MSIDGYRSPPQGGSHQGSPLPGELAKRSGVTNGFISQIEKNQVSPSVASLRKVLEGIPMSLASFFTEETEMGTEVIFRAADMPDLGTHPISYRLVGHSRANRAIGMLQEVLPPGADTGDDMLSHEGEECGIVIKGEVGSDGGRADLPADTGGWLLLRQPYSTPFSQRGRAGECADFGQHPRQFLTPMVRSGFGQKGTDV